MESSLEEQSIIYNYLDNVRKSAIQFESYCESVGLPKEVIYDTNGNQINKSLTRHEVKIAAINLRQKYKDIDSKLNALVELVEKISPSSSINNDVYIAFNKAKFNEIYPYKSAYINALKRLGIP